MRYLVIGPGAMGFYIYLGVLSRLKLGDLEEVSGASAGALLLFLFLATKGDIPAMLDHSVKIPVKQLMKPNIKNFFTKFGLVPTAKLEATIKKTCKKFLKKRMTSPSVSSMSSTPSSSMSRHSASTSKRLYTSRSTRPLT